MNSIQPHADLSHPRIQRHVAAMPNRSPRTPRNSQPRNLTGLFLGTGRSIQPPPPSRCSAPSQYSKTTRVMPSRRPRTPTEQRRHKKVEMLRIREERRGFSGNPIKNHQRGLSAGETETSANQPGSNDFWDLTRQTNRQFTSNNNTGLSHLEYLAPNPDGAVHMGPFPRTLDDTLAEEIQLANQRRKQAVGLIHCYNKICKGNRDAVYSLLPNRRSQNIADSSSHTTGFSVKSYRTPHEAQILGHFPTPQESRPRTMEALTSSRRPHVPGPYFFKGYNSSRSNEPRNSYKEHMIGLPGIELPSRGRTFHGQSSSPRGSNSPHQPMGDSSPPSKTQDHSTSRDQPRAPSTSPTSRNPRLDPIAQAAPSDAKSQEKPTEIHDKVEISLPAAGSQEQSDITAADPDGATVAESSQQEAISASTAPQLDPNTKSSGVNITATNNTNTSDTKSPSDNNTAENPDGTNVNLDTAAPDVDQAPAIAMGDTTGKEGPTQDSAVVDHSGAADQLPVPPIVIATAEGAEDATLENNPFTRPAAEGQNIEIVMRSHGRQDEINELLKEHAQIVQEIEQGQKSCMDLSKDSSQLDPPPIDPGAMQSGAEESTTPNQEQAE